MVAHWANHQTGSTPVPATKFKKMLIKRIDKTKAEVKMYGSIGGWFVDGFNFTSILDELEADGCKEVTFRMHCYGGGVFEGNVIGGAFARSSMKINIVIDGISASMACMILPYVPVENIQIAENGFGMVHRPISGGDGDAADHLSVAKLLLDIEGNFIRTLAQRTGKPAEEIKSKFFDGKDHWLNADEMVSYKLAGSKIKSVASIAELDKQQIENMGEQAVYGHFAATLEPDSNIPNNKKSKTMKKDLIDAFHLTGVTAESSDTAVLAALQAKFKANEDRLTALETEAKAKKATAIKAALDAAVTAGKITAEVRPTYEAIGEASGAEVLNTVLSGLGVKTPIVSMLGKEHGAKGGEHGAKNWDWYQKNDAKALEAMPVSDPDGFKALYKAEYGCDPTM
jgi:ATP-dependent Clp protease protease subunit